MKLSQRLANKILASIESSLKTADALVAERTADCEKAKQAVEAAHALELEAIKNGADYETRREFGDKTAYAEGWASSCENFCWRAQGWQAAIKLLLEKVQADIDGFNRAYGENDETAAVSA